jgi:autotransporter-associated beta strand protein
MSRFYTVNINAGLTLTTGGILVGSGVDDGGVFYINGPGSLRGPAGQELVFLNHPLGITRYHPSVIAAPIVDNGSATGFTYSGLVPASGMGELLFLTGTNTYTGTTRILGGTLSIGNGGTTGSLHPSSQIVNDGTLIINRSDNVAQGTIFASTISGSGSLTKSGTGTLTLTGTNTYSGNTTVNAGTLQIGADNALGSSILVLNGGAIEASGASRTITAQDDQRHGSDQKTVGSFHCRVRRHRRHGNQRQHYPGRSIQWKLGQSLQVRHRHAHSLRCEYLLRSDHRQSGKTLHQWQHRSKRHYGCQRSNSRRQRHARRKRHHRRRRQAGVQSQHPCWQP